MEANTSVVHAGLAVKWGENYMQLIQQAVMLATTSVAATAVAVAEQGRWEDDGVEQ